MMPELNQFDDLDCIMSRFYDFDCGVSTQGGEVTELQ